ncbi:MAG: phosphoribosyltransferase regulatory subunit [Pseudomonadota bacterium]|jgi:ATP phosphoribosyltransferase regulatory subunit
MMKWLLPESVADALPDEAARLEALRRRLLDLCVAHGYELVQPPLIEYLDSLLTGAGRDLNLRTFKLVDQNSGRSLGVRADMTAQVARIDAHLLNRPGVVRLCYCDSVLHAQPADMQASREPFQLGAELYGYADLAADLEIVRLAAATLQAAGAAAARIDLGHMGIFRTLMTLAGVSAEGEEYFFKLLQRKDVPGLEQETIRWRPELRQAILALPRLYGDRSVLDAARQVLPQVPAIHKALDDLNGLVSQAADLPLYIDLSDLRGYHYHSGIVFAAYCPGDTSAMALGGRYDGVGAAFGRARPATGFSLDLRELCRLATVDVIKGAIFASALSADASAVDGAARAQVISELRAQGERVIDALPGERLDTKSGIVYSGAVCDRQLVQKAGQWVVEPC